MNNSIGYLQKKNPIQVGCISIDLRQKLRNVKWTSLNGLDNIQSLKAFSM